MQPDDRIHQLPCGAGLLTRFWPWLHRRFRSGRWWGLDRPKQIRKELQMVWKVTRWDHPGAGHLLQPQRRHHQLGPRIGGSGLPGSRLQLHQRLSCLVNTYFGKWQHLYSWVEIPRGQYHQSCCVLSSQHPIQPQQTPQDNPVCVLSSHHFDLSPHPFLAIFH